jgi:hypothetical protein
VINKRICPHREIRGGAETSEINDLAPSSIFPRSLCRLSPSSLSSALRLAASRRIILLPLFPAPANMLATLPSAAPEHDGVRRPAKDKEAFFSLLPPAVEFIEGSSSGTLVVGHSKLEPINCSPKHAKRDVRSSTYPCARAS